MSMKTKAAILFKYLFKFGDGEIMEFDAELDSVGLKCLSCPPAENAPGWARLSKNQCPNCPFSEAEYAVCPVALNISPLVAAFANRSSYENVLVTVMSRERDVANSTTLEVGLTSLMGIYMVTGGCPVMDRLKPLVRYHLPFASIHESAVRVVSMYLLIQYFKNKKTGAKPDWDLKDLPAIYDEISVVNSSMTQRVKKAVVKDAVITALGNLNYLSNLVPLILTDTYDEIKGSLNAYL